MSENIRKLLFGLQDTGYKEFHAKLIPNISPDTVIGVRAPVLRKLAKELMGSADAAEFLLALPHQYYDENNLHGFLISQMKDYQSCICLLNEFLPYIDNWAVCDGIAPKIFKKHLPELLEEITIWLESGHTYTVRFGIGMLMKFYLDEHFCEEYLKWVSGIHSQEYYVNMMIAWYFATALAKQYEAVLPYLEEQKLDIWVHNKTIQKALESYRVSAEHKAYLKRLKK